MVDRKRVRDMDERLRECYRKIPKVDLLMETEGARALREIWGYRPVLWAAQRAEEEIRRRLGEGQREEAMRLLEDICGEMEGLLKEEKRRKVGRVVNGTGVALHTNLGRAPLGERVSRAVCRAAEGYSSLEMDLRTGERGDRCEAFSRKLCRLTGAEAALAVNNNAAAVLLMLSALCRGREVPVSRGELVEIGGKFRVPMVMEESGALLVEVGTTNRTYLEDYEAALGENTGALLKVHTSNYRILGFTHQASVRELSQLGKSRGIPLLVDLGSGAFLNFSQKGLPGEPSVGDILGQGADLVAFSGDKLMGGPQAGILAGDGELIQRIGRHPLMRALRIDKCTAAALEETMDIYLEGREWEELPALSCLARGKEELFQMAQGLKEKLERKKENWKREAVLTVTAARSTPGGGAMPLAEMDGAGLLVTLPGVASEELSRLLRAGDPPVVGRIFGEGVLLDMRTVLPQDFQPLLKVLEGILEGRA
ncbi:MAG: L-seryl-tRNA(Sec) selenium transferase [Eubacteriales bacterium]|nr:L-seryl-tRNA(Sec) selenium transferase [Eubacteriales bacterium]